MYDTVGQNKKETNLR